MGNWYSIPDGNPQEISHGMCCQRSVFLGSSHTTSDETPRIADVQADFCQSTSCPCSSINSRSPNVKGPMSARLERYSHAQHTVCY